jgi:hypothetical protein
MLFKTHFQYSVNDRFFEKRWTECMRRQRSCEIIQAQLSANVLIAAKMSNGWLVEPYNAQIFYIIQGFLVVGIETCVLCTKMGFTTCVKWHGMIQIGRHQKWSFNFFLRKKRNSALRTPEKRTFSTCFSSFKWHYSSSTE